MKTPVITLTTTGWDPGMHNRFNRKDVKALAEQATKLLAALRRHDQELADRGDPDDIFPFHQEALAP